MLANSEGLVFAGQRFDSSRAAWQMPQGGIDFAEEPIDAAYRELEEETGVCRELVSLEAEMEQWLNYDLPQEMIPKLWSGRFRGQTQKWHLFRFLGDDGQINIDTEYKEFSRWRWVSTSQLMDSVVPFKRETYRAVIKAFGSKL